MSFDINKKMIDGRELIFLTIPEFSGSGLVKHCFTTRVGGVSEGAYSTLNTSLDKEDIEENVFENLRTVCSAVGIDHTSLVSADQVHEDKIWTVTAEDMGKGITEPSDIVGIDALITNVPGIPLITFYADCVPVFLLDVENKAVALIHSGWRGTVRKISAKTLKEMNKVFGTKPENCLAGIGPSIEKSCFEIGIDTVEEFQKSFENWKELIEKTGKDKYLADLWMANSLILQEEGVPTENINICGMCTICREDLFFSYRRDKGTTGSLSAIIQLI